MLIYINERGKIIDSTDVSGLLSDGEVVYAGVPFTFKYQFSEPVVKINNQPITTASLRIRNWSVVYDDTGFFTVETTPARRSTYTRTFTGRLVGGAANLLNKAAIDSGTYQFGVVGNANYNYNPKSDSQFTLCISVRRVGRLLRPTFKENVMKGQWRKSTQADVDYLAVNLRPEDAIEVLSSHGNIKEALQIGLDESDECWTFVVSDTNEIAGMFGVAKYDDDIGVIWLLSSLHIQKIWLPFLRQSKKWVVELNNKYPVLTNACDAE